MIRCLGREQSWLSPNMSSTLSASFPQIFASLQANASIASRVYAVFPAVHSAMSASNNTTDPLYSLTSSPRESEITPPNGQAPVYYNGGSYPQQPTGFGLEVYDESGNVLLSSRAHAAMAIGYIQHKASTGDFTYLLPSDIGTSFIITPVITRRSSGTVPVVFVGVSGGQVSVTVADGTADCDILILGA